MLGAIDDLVEHLLQHMALAASQGVSPVDLERLVSDFYARTTTNSPNSSIPLRRINTQSSPLSASSPLVDSFLLEQVWTWLVARPEVFVGPLNEYADLSLAAAKALYAQQKAAGIDHRPVQVVRPPTRISKRAKRNRASDVTESIPDPRPAPVCLYTTEHRMWLAVCGHGVDHKRVPPLEFTLLSIIASHGAAGIAQTELTRISGQDKRSLPKRTDNLSKKGYVVKKSIINRGTRTSLLTLRRFIDLATGSSGDVPAAASSAGSFDTFGDRLLSADGQIHLDRVVDVIYDVLKDAKTLPVDTVKQRLGYNRTTWPKRFLPGALRKLAMIGLIVRIKVKVEYQAVGKTVLTKALKLIRPPTDKDRALFLTIGEHEARENDVKKSGNKDSTDVAHDSFDESDGDIDMAEQSGAEGDDTSTTVSKPATPTPIPQWDPDLPLVNLIFTAVNRAGTDGISSMDLRTLLFGTFWRRPFDTIMARLTDAWERSQPAYLQHFIVIKDTAMTNKQVHFTYRTANNYAALVAAGQTDWQAVMSGPSTANPADPVLPTFLSSTIVSAFQHGWGTVDQWGLPHIRPDFLVGGTGRATLKQLNGLARDRTRSVTTPDLRYRRRDSALASVPSTPVSAAATRRMTHAPTVPTPVTPKAPEPITPAPAYSTSEVEPATPVLLTSTGKALSRKEAEKRLKAHANRVAEYRKSLVPWAERLWTAEQASSGRSDEGNDDEGDDSRDKEPAGSRKRRRVGDSGRAVAIRTTNGSTGSGSTGSSVGSKGERIEELVDELVNRKYCGVYVGAPSAMRSFARGRPRLQLVVVIKLDRLRSSRMKLPDDHILRAGGKRPVGVGQNRLAAISLTGETDGESQVVELATATVCASSPRVSTEVSRTGSIATRLSAPITPTPTRTNGPSGKVRGFAGFTQFPSPKVVSPLVLPSANSIQSIKTGLAVSSGLSGMSVGPSLSSLATTLTASSPALPCPIAQPVIPSSPVPTGPPSPSPLARMNKKSNGLYIGGGLMGFNRTKILVDLVVKCGGVAPGGTELYQPFRDAWTAKYAGTQPDTKTMNRALLFAVQTCHLIRIPFTFTPASGELVEVVRHVVTLPDVARNDPRIDLLQRRIIGAYPDHHIPSELGVGPRKRNTAVRDLYVLDPSTRIDPLKNVPLWVQRHMENMQIIADRRLARIADREAMTAARTGAAQARAAQRRTRVVIASTDTWDDTENVDSHLPSIEIEASEEACASAASDVAVVPMADHETEPETHPRKVRNTNEQARDRLMMRKHVQMLFVPLTQYFPSLGVFGTFPELDGRKVRGWTTAARTQVKIGERGPFIAAPFRVGNPRQVFFRLTGTFGDCPFVPTVPSRRLPARLTGRRRVLPPPNYSIVRAPTRAEQAAVSIAASMQARRKRRPRQKPEALLAAVTGAGPVDRSGMMLITPSVKPKGTKQAVATFTGRNRLLTVIVSVVQVLAGGVGLMINWTIVQKLCDCFPEADFPVELTRLAYRWRCISKPHEAVIDSFSDHFREMYLAAYAAGEVDRLDYNALSEYDWLRLVNWALEKIDLDSIIAQHEMTEEPLVEEPVVLPASPDELFSTSVVDVAPPVLGQSTAALPETFYNIKTLYQLRTVRTHETRFVVLHGLAGFPSPDKSRSELAAVPAPDSARAAYSIVRASVATPEPVFRAVDASRRVAGLPAVLIERSIRDLLRRSLIGKTHSGGQLAPGRNWRLTDLLFTILNRSAGHTAIQSACAFKHSLDDIVLAGRSPPDLTYETPVSDGLVLALLNMVGSGLVKIEPVIPPIKGVYRPPLCLGTPGPFISPWGWLGDRYQTRKMDRRLLYLPVRIVPTTKYIIGDPMETNVGRVPIPGSAEIAAVVASQSTVDHFTGIPSFGSTIDKQKLPVPIWRDVHDGVIEPIWRRLVGVVGQTVALRPGIRPAGLAAAVKDTVDEWELNRLVEWMVQVGVVRWCGPDGRDGLIAADWWWMVAGRIWTVGKEDGL